MIVFVADFLLDDLEIGLEGLNLLGLQSHHRMTAGEKEQRTDILHTLDNLMEEVHADHHAEPFHVRRVTIAVYDMLFADDKDVARGDVHLLAVELIHNLSFRTEPDDDEVHLSGLCGHRCLVDAFRQQEVIVQKDRFAPLFGLFKISFLDLQLFFYHVLMFWVWPAFILMVFCCPLYNKVIVPLFLALMVHERTPPVFHSKLTS